MKFDKNIPLPVRRNMGEKTRREILMEMEVGDSFRVEPEKMKRWSAAITRYSENGKKFTVRKYEDAYRLWRIE